MSDDNGRDKPTNGLRGRRPAKGRASSAIARPKAPQRPQVASRAARKTAAEQEQPPEPAENAGATAAVEAEKADENVPPPGPENAGAKVLEENLVAAEREDPAPKRVPKRRSPVSKAGAQRGGARQRADGSQKRADAGGAAAPSVDPVRPTSPERFDLPTVDPMADLVGLAERSLRESLQSLRSVSESRTLSELLDRQSRHMRLMTEIWMRQAQRSMEVFNAMLSQRRK